MKTLLTAALMFLATLAGATGPRYYDLQNYLVVPDTTNINTKYEYRGDFYLGRDTYTPSLDLVPKGVILFSSGTIWAKRIEGNIYGNIYSTANVVNANTVGNKTTDYLLTPGNLYAGALPSTVIASSVAANSIYPGALQANTSNQPYNIWVASAVNAMNGGSGGSGAIDSFPIGTMIAYSSTSTIPDSFYLCEGSTRSRTTDGALFAVIGTKFGTGDGSTTFNLPDMRGMFFRGLDNGRGYDAESGRVIGSTETDKFQGHKHATNYDLADNGTHGGYIAPYNASTGSQPSIAVMNPTTDGVNGTPRTGTETNPKNVAVAYIIKYRLSTSTAIAIYDTPGTFTKTIVFSSSTKYADGNEQTQAYITTKSSSVIASAGSVPSTTSSTFSDISGNVYTSTITVQAGSRLLIGFTGAGRCGSVGGGTCLDIVVNGTRIGNSTYGFLEIDQSTLNYIMNYSFTCMTAPLAAGTYNVKPQWRAATNGQTSSLFDGSGYSANFWVQEIR